MIRRAGAGLLVLGSSLLAVGACGGDPDLSDPESAASALAEVQCDFRARCCGDGDGGVVSQGTGCVERSERRWLDLIDVNSSGSGDYPFDPACAQAFYTLFETASCTAEDTLFDQLSLCDFGYCWSGFYHGDKQEGESCFESLECDGPYQCVDGYCQSPCGLQEGSLCADPEGNQVRNCRPELYCNRSTRLCATYPTVAQPCPDGTCEVGAYCDFETEVCNKLKSGGSTCESSYECESQNCELGECEIIPTLGQPCTSQCVTGLYCLDGLCDRLPESGEACYDGYLCAEGLDCVNDVCRRPGGSDESLLCEAF